MPVGDTDPFRPDRQRPVRVRARELVADTHFEPHHHAWGQLAYCASGVLQVTAAQHAGADDATTYIVPPSRAVWIAPGARHAVHALEDAGYFCCDNLPPELLRDFIHLEHQRFTHRVAAAMDVRTGGGAGCAGRAGNEGSGARGRIEDRPVRSGPRRQRPKRQPRTRILADPAGAR